MTTAFPARKIVFIASFSHWVRVRQALPAGWPAKRHPLWVPLVGLKALRALLRHPSVAARFFPFSVIFLSDLREASYFARYASAESCNISVAGVVHTELEANRVTSSSLTPGIQRTVLTRKPLNRRVLVLHSWENVIIVAGNVFRRLREIFRPDKPTRRVESYRLQVELDVAPKIIALSPHIIRAQPAIKFPVKAVMMPFSIYPHEAPSKNQPDFSRKRLYFGTIGTGNNEVFLRLFENLFTFGAGKQPENLILIKAMTMNSRGFDRYQSVHSFRGGRIPRKTVETELSDVAFFLFPYGPQDFVSSASGSQMEILRFGIPHISLRNPHMEELHRVFGDIGTLCDDEESWAATIRSYAEDRKLARETWERQREVLRTAQTNYVKLVVEDLKACFE